MKKSHRFANFFQVKKYSPQIKWEIPSEFVLPSNWHVVSGEDSEEKAVQELRESSVFEALYHHSSFIPRNPFFPAGIEDQCYDDSQTPLIPIIPVEETAEATITAPPSNAAEGDSSLDEAVAVVSAIMKSMDPESLIDTDLLIKILSDPNMTTELVNKYRLANANISIPSESSMPENAQLSLERIMPAGRHTVSLPVSKPSLLNHGGNAYVAARMDPLTKKTVRDYGLPDKLQTSERPATESLPAPVLITEDNNAKTAVPILKDINYYKSLIKQHGEDPETRDEKQSHHRNMQANNLQKHEFSHKKYQKACKFFNTSKGCKNGSRCRFRHETYKQQRPNAKKMKLGSGREHLRRT